MMGKKFGQIIETWIRFYDGEVTPVQNIFTHGRTSLNKPSEMRIHLWGTSCNVNGGDISFLKNIETMLECFFAHNLFSVRTGIYMTVGTTLIAQLANIYL